MRQMHRKLRTQVIIFADDIIPSLIPGGCTGLVQPLDVCINGPFKNILRNVLDTHMDNLGQAALNAYDVQTESAVGQRRILMTKCVAAETWELVSLFTTLIIEILYQLACTDIALQCKLV